MRWRSSKELREMFLAYFEEKGCRRYKSFPLVPDDPTLLFTVAGMVPFKPYFLGLKTPETTRATSAQKCLRTNDIDNVGRTARHHTFFEMLGNFSFGDYFKSEIIPWAWQFLTGPVGFDPDRLYATVYRDDDEAAAMWQELVGLPKERVFRLGEEDNFWAAGPTGPCGPCSEIIYDQGPEFSCGKPDCGVGCDCDRYLEIWNLVFMQFSRDEAGILTPLPKKNIDTGMGLERLCAVAQQVSSNFGSDLFVPIMDATARIAGVRSGDSPKSDLALRVIADHLRASAFMIADGVLPSVDGTGYVLRRLVRRSARYGRLIGLDRPFLTELLPAVREVMGDEYPELLEYNSTIEQVIELEERRFGHTIVQGEGLLESEIAGVGKEKRLSGEVAFVLYDTYGFPLELTEEICAESGVTVGRDEFNAAMQRQRDMSRAASKQTGAVMGRTIFTELADELGPTGFDGYSVTEEKAEITAIIAGGVRVESVTAGEDDLYVVLSRTPFYAERGGQVGDRGELTAPGVRFDVVDTVTRAGDTTLHQGVLTSGELRVGMELQAAVDKERRDAIRRHHTATHLLHEALGRVVGRHARQAGSLVTPTFLRFDYNHFAPLSREQLNEIENIISDVVLSALPVETAVMSYEEARKSGSKALFEEKYGDEVRVVSVEGYSTELCGGVHVQNTGQIGLVKILRDEGIGSGVRRINAVAGKMSLTLLQTMSERSLRMAELFGVDIESVTSKAEEMLDEKRLLERKNQQLALKAIMADADVCLQNAQQVRDLALITHILEDVPKEVMRLLGDRLRQKEPHAVILLASSDGESVNLIGMASDDAVAKGVHAGNLVREVAKLMGGSGGGKPAIGQAGGKDPSRLPEALKAASELLEALLQKKAG